MYQLKIDLSVGKSPRFVSAYQDSDFFIRASSVGFVVREGGLFAHRRPIPFEAGQATLSHD